MLRRQGTPADRRPLATNPARASRSSPHNPITMARTNVLFGVTIAEEGVSRLGFGRPAGLRAHAGGELRGRGVGRFGRLLVDANPRNRLLPISAMFWRLPLSRSRA